MILTIALPGPHATAESYSFEAPENTTVGAVRDKLNVHFNANVKLIGKKKEDSTAPHVTLNDKDKVPARVMVNGLKTLKGFAWSGSADAASKSLTYDEAFALQTKLRQCFEDPDFTREFEALKAKHNEKDTVSYRSEFQTLVRAVQFRVMPDFGFPADDTGVNAMLSAMQPHMDEEKFAEQGKVINALLGLPDNRELSFRKSFNRNRRPSVPKATVPDGFTKVQAMALQRELYEGFTTDEFEEKLSQLYQMYGEGMEYMKGLREICLEVQKEVLPKYGFPGSSAGVRQMIGAYNAFLGDEDIKNMADEINKLLGLQAANPNHGKGNKWDEGLTAAEEATFIKN